MLGTAITSQNHWMFHMKGFKNIAQGWNQGGKMVSEKGNVRLKERDKSKETKTGRGWGAEKQQQKIKLLIVAFRFQTCFQTIW
jgi:hypothetical protein